MRRMKISSDTVVAITGASRGIGRATALAFARKGAKLVLLSRDRAKMEVVADEVRALGTDVLVVSCDVSKQSECRAWVPVALERFGHVDVLVNNAGFGVYAKVEELTEEILESEFRTNLYGSIWCAQAVLPGMKQRHSGHIVNVSTVISRRSLPFMSAYCMSKFAMNAFDESLRVEIRREGIGVSLVCPGLTATDFQMNSHKINYKPPMRNKFGMSAEKVADTIVRCVERNRRHVHLTGLGKTLVFLQRFVPGFLDWVFLRGMVERHKEAAEPVVKVVNS